MINETKLCLHWNVFYRLMCGECIAMTYMSLFWVLALFWRRRDLQYCCDNCLGIFEAGCLPNSISDEFQKPN